MKTVSRAPRHIQIDLRWRLGDEVMALPIYRALFERYRRCRISVCCNYADLLLGNPYAAAADPGGGAPDRIICLRDGPRHVQRLAHYARLARVPLPQWRPRLHYDDWHAPQLHDIDRPFIAVAPGASWAIKRWDAARWRAVCRAAQDLGYEVVALGHAGEQPGVGMSLAGMTSVREAACVLRAARLLVTADSGLMHLALAAGTPALALFGPTDPDILVRNEPLFHAVRSGIECAGCWNRREEPLEPGVCPRTDGGREPGCALCMKAITADEVVERLRRILG